MESLFSAFVGKAAVVDTVPHEAAAHDLETVLLMGFSGHYVRIGAEPHYLGSMRLITSGCMKVVCAAADDLLKAADVRDGLVGKNTLAHAKSILSSLAKKEDASGLTEHGAQFYHAVVQAGQMLFVPPGYVTAFAVMNGDPCGLCRKFLLPKRGSEDRLAFLSARAPEEVAECLNLLRQAVSAKRLCA
ncbi:unnamed protein product [Prorocentrum cordatum]|nr:unnamed protein product [Polarella glacialis]CAK0864417.1 unnamed protein product [Polarella glacialis]